MYEGITYGLTKLFRSNCAICVELTLGVRIAPVNIENLSAIITTCCTPVIVLGSTSELLMVTDSRGPSAGKAEASACASHKIHSGCNSNIFLQACTHH